MIPKRTKMPARKTLVNHLDAAFSKRIKDRDMELRGRCPFHESFAPIEHCFHFITRAKHSVRWDDRNACGSCAGCNIRYEFDQTFVDQVFSWYKMTHGEEAWETLKRDANIIVKRSRADLMELLASIRTAE